MSKALIYNPYLKSLGGGERYSLHLIEYLLKNDYKVELAWDEPEIKKIIKERLNINIEKAKINPEIFKLFSQKKNLYKKYQLTSNFNLIFFVSDGSIPFLFGQKNLLHFQVPFQRVNGKNFLNQLKLKFIHHVICNSIFTKKVIDKEFKIESKVIYPPLAKGFAPGLKKNIIISVGRFDNLGHSKKQDLLIKVFKELIDNSQLAGWKLILAGGVLNNKFVENLKRLTLNYPIEIYQNVNFEKLKIFYSQAKIYWHAAGIGENLRLFPERAEHFGISVVEAMAAGCVPIVFAGGGLPEIVRDKKDGFLFQSLSDLKRLTLQMAKNDKLRKLISQKAIERSYDFSLENFYRSINEIIS